MRMQIQSIRYEDAEWELLLWSKHHEVKKKKKKKEKKKFWVEENKRGNERKTIQRCLPSFGPPLEI